MSSLTEKKLVGRVAVWLSFFCLSYPFIAIAMARIHYAFTAKDFSQRTESLLLLLVFPVVIGCGLAFVLALRANGKERAIGLICSPVAVMLNALFFLAVGTSY